MVKAAKNSIVPVPCVAQTAKHTLDVGDGAIVPNANAADTDREATIFNKSFKARQKRSARQSRIS